MLERNLVKMVVKKRINLLLALIFVAISLVLFFLVLKPGEVLQENEIPVAVKISDNSAFNINKNETTLNLGTTEKGGFAERKIDISNTYPFKTEFEFSVNGTIAELLVFEPLVYFEPEEDKKISFRTKLIENETFGDYNGTIFVKIRRV